MNTRKNKYFSKRANFSKTSESDDKQLRQHYKNLKNYAYRDAPAEYESSAVYQNIFNDKKSDNRKLSEKLFNFPTHNQSVSNNIAREYKNFLEQQPAINSKTLHWLLNL